MAEYNIFSFGGGVQSTAALVLAAQGQLDYAPFVFANVGDDSENPRTLAYIEQYAKPFAAEHGIELATAHKRINGKHETLLHYIHRMESSIPIPMRMMPSGAPGRRPCTIEFKIYNINVWVRDHLAARGDTIHVGLGITIDEIHRARVREPEQIYGITKHVTYPLIDLGISRNDCVGIIEGAGLPTPPKSSCWFCPYTTPAGWAAMKEYEPELFDKAVGLERMLQQRRENLGKDKVYFLDKGVTLDVGIGDQMRLWPLDEFENCESGYCMI